MAKLEMTGDQELRMIVSISVYFNEHEVTSPQGPG